MAGKQYTGLAASFDLESYGLDPVYGRLLVGVIKPWKGEPVAYRMEVAKSDDSELVSVMVEELSKYMILIAHNGLFHDRAFLNGRATSAGLPVLDTNCKLIDPYQIARRHFNARRNSLDALAQFLHLPEQKMHLDPEVWVKAALDRDEDAMSLLTERCISDCQVLEDLTERMLPLVGNITPWGSR